MIHIQICCHFHIHYTLYKFYIYMYMLFKTHFKTDRIKLSIYLQIKKNHTIFLKLRYITIYRTFSINLSLIWSFFIRLFHLILIWFDLISCFLFCLENSLCYTIFKVANTFYCFVHFQLQCCFFLNYTIKINFLHLIYLSNIEYI